ncbi:Membrane proteinase PrsW, cleaves anti-sigma factor RsiW, M82 family [Halogranum amylolyticum]|uniref:Membrane proteinase PrsW, cleaves anti-sigma factor RsiW, M82 family n=1 Tax=Halogranum amylolyticum TaxID=660520 RepID=A0A1H8QCN7_9EURY|nr:PrsW family intramembrane metalloprotease [Halogranum amylolyticum]SEO51543.1 Membrane proteinase PrsW, cleaves anti-sigma factor RsiW, M82 family [Halogranum amylolyticum]
MAERRDAVEEETDESVDLYDISTWEERTSLDGLAVALYRLLAWSARFVVVASAFLILLGIGGLAALTDLQTSVLTLLSAIPALGLAAYVYYSDVTTGEPLSLLVATFMLGVLTASFAAVVNSLLGPMFRSIAVVGSVLFFFLVVAPIEETVKLLAVRLYAYRSSRFDAVVDGAVYGAMAGLGFATIENSLYIAQQLGENVDFGLGLIGAGNGIAVVRALAGPGHVIYSAFAGYYLGLAKFNREDAGPIVIKGLIIAAFIHATYNSTVGVASGAIAAITGLPGIVAFIVYIVVYDGFFALLLFRKIRRYTKAYRAAHESDRDVDRVVRSETTEFE